MLSIYSNEGYTGFYAMFVFPTENYPNTHTHYYDDDIMILNEWMNNIMTCSRCHDLQAKRNENNNNDNQKKTRTRPTQKIYYEINKYNPWFDIIIYKKPTKYTHHHRHNYNHSEWSKKTIDE